MTTVGHPDFHVMSAAEDMKLFAGLRRRSTFPGHAPLREGGCGARGLVEFAGFWVTTRSHLSESFSLTLQKVRRQIVAKLL
jgi:hypothetical protein